MTNKEILKKKIIYRSEHRGNKEMDILLGTFVKKYINQFNDSELHDLEKLLMVEDEILSEWYFKNKLQNKIPNSNISILLKNFKL
tara:strand:+ start:551 stop:805 length:255 start_codon:yes stop_codon:yes gene_type:complete